MNWISSATPLADNSPPTPLTATFLPIAKKTLTIFLPLFLLVMCAIATAYWSEIKNYQLTIKGNEKASVILGKRLILDTLAPVMADLLFLSKTVAASNLLAAPPSPSVRKSLEAEFIHFSAAHGYYDQIRVLDAAGTEILRINYNGGQPVAVPGSALQPKKHRYYFSETMKLAQDEIYVSPMDLNIERNAVELPFKPMIRLATPITGGDGDIEGIAIINYTAQKLLDNFSRAAKNEESQLMLLNKQGYWLKSDDPAQEWGFMFHDGEGRTFGERFPAVWKQIQSSESGQFDTDQGIFSYSTVYPLLDCPEWVACLPSTSTQARLSYAWIIVSRLPSGTMLAEEMPILIKAIAASLVAFCILIFLSYRLAVADVRRRNVEMQLRQAKENLEQIVVRRTGELQRTNQELRSQIEEREKVEDALRRSESQYRTLVETMREGICVIDAEDRFSFVNNQFAAMLDYPAEEILAHRYSEFLDPANLIQLDEERKKRRLGTGAPYELQWLKKSGTPVLTYVSPSAYYDEKGRFSGSFAVVTDITEQKKSASEKAQLELQLRQAQKMEAIGVLAGGIAHDFNNILTPIMGYAELIEDALPEGDPAHGFIHPILEASQRAKELVAQILSFSRQSSDERQPALMAPLVKEPLKLIKASLPSNIEIESHIQAKDAMIMANPVQIHQLVMNLCTNAYHAMEDTGGKLTVRLFLLDSGACVDEVTAADALSHVCLSVADTGVGIAADALVRIFEPYFTTKEKDKGTGLGLSVVHGIVKSCGGDIRVDSDPGKGTCFTVILPLISTPSRSASADFHKKPDGGNESILLVDDEEPIVNLEKNILERMGYRVTTRLSSLDALETFRSDPGRFDLVITDLTMPNLLGLELARRIHTMRTDIPILMMTGFSERLDASSLEQAGIRQVIMKPALAKDLARAIRHALDAGRQN